MNADKINSRINASMYNKQFRRALTRDTIANVAQLGYGRTSGIEFRVVRNTKNTVYCVIPKNDARMSMDDLKDVDAAGTFSTMGTLSTICSCASSAGSWGTLVSNY